ncbi:uncharacterized protein LOC135487723 [Lineus longissimus]|uniref:uncharacterized protein LOC135487723 n=1 Tax=Lineus longissimus TaxID=88925 RepID=UPI00315D5093
MTSVYFITILLVSVAVSSAAPSTRNDETFVGCMSKCLIGGGEQDRVTAVYKICKDSATCWGEHLGDRVQKCASGCKDPAPEELLVWTAIESSSLVVSDVPEFVKCMAKCMGKSLEQVEEWYKECKKNAKCWMKKVGLRGLKCAGKCLKADETTALLATETIESSSLVVSDVPEFVKCMAKCMGKSLEQVEEWYKECKKNAKCWMKKVGLQGLKCAGKCLKADETTALLATETIESSSLVVSDVPEFVKCMAKCMGKSLEQVEEWYKECKKNAKCWMKKVGLQGLKCAGKCLKADETTALLATETIESSSLVVSDVPEFVKCMAKCMGKSLEQVEEWYKECKKNAKCWMKKVGLQGLKCAGKCLKADETTALLATESLVEPEDNSGFILCMAKCLGKTITEIKAWYKECKKKAKCWVKKVGKKALKCVGKCILSETNMTQEMAVTPAVETAIEKPDKEEVIGFLVCMAVCIGKDYNEIKQWYNECKKSVTCWVKKAGWKAVKCVGKCFLLDEKTATSTIETGPVNNNFLKCMAECLKKDISEILAWYNKCHTNIGCWLKEAGSEGLKCAGHCLFAREDEEDIRTTLELTPVNNDFVNCMPRCLGKDVSIILNWFNKCHTDVKCWLKEVGFEGLKCAGQCVGEEDTKSKIAPIPSQSDLVKFASYEKIIQIVKDSKSPLSSRRL